MIQSNASNRSICGDECVFSLPSRCCGFSRGYRVIVYSKLTATCALPLIWSSVMADTHSQLSKMAASSRMTVRLLFSLRGDWNVRLREPSKRERGRDGCVFSRSVSLQAVFLVVSEAWRMCAAPPLLFLPPALVWLAKGTEMETLFDSVSSEVSDLSECSKDWAQHLAVGWLNVNECLKNS